MASQRHRSTRNLEVLRGPKEGRRWRRSNLGKLPPGPGHTRAEVAEHQRARLHEAMVELVVERGYRALTVRELSARAQISSGALYRHYANLDECFVATEDLVFARAAERFRDAAESGLERREQLELALRRLARDIVGAPDAARFVLVEAPAAGPALLPYLRSAAARVGDAIGDLVAPGRARPLPSSLREAVVTGLARVARGAVMAGRADELAEMSAEAAEWICRICDEAGVGLFEVEGESPAVADGSRGAVPTPGDERTMILAAATKLAAKEGYDTLTIPRIRRAAGVSREAFDTHFDGVEDCFLDALDYRVRQVFTASVRQAASGDTWPDRVHDALDALCTGIGADPERTRATFVEIFAAGEAGVKRGIGLLDETARAVRAFAPAGMRPNPFCCEASVAAIWGLLGRTVEEGRGAEAPALVPALSFLVLAPSIGAAEAIAVVERPRFAAGRAPRTSRNRRASARNT